MKNNQPTYSASAESYASSQPYPEINVSGVNAQYAMLLQSNYAAMVSEFTSINTYNYQSLIVWPNNPALSNALHQIAIVEMRHLHMLGQTIILLGGNPQYMAVQKNRAVYWNGRMVQYKNDAAHLLQHNISSEQYAIEAYQQHSQMIKDPNIQQLLQRIIQDEEIHITLFQQYLASC